MQCVHFKGTKCVFDRGNAVTTCSKWPELQIIYKHKHPTHNVSIGVVMFRIALWVSVTETKHFVILFSQKSLNGAKECCCCMLNLHYDRFRWSPKILAQGPFHMYLYLPILYKAQV